MQSKSKLNLGKTWIEISKKALISNIDSFQKIVGRNCKVCPVVKANAYGHGLREVVDVLTKKSIDILAVDSFEEALTVRMQGFAGRVIILGFVKLDQIGDCIENEFSFVVYNQEALEKILKIKSKKKTRIHFKCETGLNRQGLRKKELLDLARLADKHKDKIIIEGVSTHFANIEDTLDPSFANTQVKRFNDVVVSLKKVGINPTFKHCAASAGTLLYKNTHFNMVRMGIALYGLWPSKETKIALRLKKRNVKLYPVLTWKSVVAQVKAIKTGESVSYGRTWFAPKDGKIAVIPIGYSDGFDRKLSNTGRVIINGKFAPVIGRVAMNMIVVDVTNISRIKTEDGVVLIGSFEGKEITVEEIADKTGTINYEVIARINPLIKRIIV